MSWTEERVELLRKLWAEGHSASQIANEIANGVTRNAVIGKVHRLGLAGRVKSPPSGQQRNRNNDRSARSPSANASMTTMVSTGAMVSTGVMASTGTIGSSSPMTSTATMAQSPMSNSMLGATGGAARPGSPIVHGNVAYAITPQMQEAVEIKAQSEAVVLPMSERVTIMELRDSMCRWPLGDPTSPDFRYCGAESPIGTGPYCAYHSSVAYQPVQDRRRDRAKTQGHH